MDADDLRELDGILELLKPSYRVKFVPRRRSRMVGALRRLMNRRHFLWTTGMAAAGVAAAQEQRSGSGRRGNREGGSQATGLQPLDGGKIGNTPAMKITDIK